MTAIAARLFLPLIASLSLTHLAAPIALTALTLIAIVVSHVSISSHGSGALFLPVRALLRLNRLHASA
jgi:hypothetical protein